MFTGCLLYIHYIFTIGSLRVHRMFTVCQIESRTLFNIQTGEGSCLDGAKQKISASRFLIIWFLYMGFYCIQYLFTMYSLYVYWMFTVYSLYTHYRLTMCSPYDHCMSNRVTNLIQYSGKRFLFGWRIAENFSLKVLNYLVLLYLFLLYSLSVHYVLTIGSLRIHRMVTICQIG